MAFAQLQTPRFGMPVEHSRLLLDTVDHHLGLGELGSERELVEARENSAHALVDKAGSGLVLAVIAQEITR